MEYVLFFQIARSHHFKLKKNEKEIKAGDLFRKRWTMAAINCLPSGQVMLYIILKKDDKTFVAQNLSILIRWIQNKKRNSYARDWNYFRDTETE